MKLLDFLEENNLEFALNEPLSKHTNFKIGGNCTVMVFPKTISKCVRLLSFLRDEKINYYILGAGTNVLCSDDGYDGVIVKIGGQMKDYKIDGNTIFASAGMNLFELNRILLANNFEGLEFSYGIPASVGGAVCMNAGAYNQCVGNFIKSVKVFDGTKIRTLTNSQMNFSYRHSVIIDKKYVVLGATFVFKKGDTDTIKKLQREYLSKRLNSQPYHEACAGSVFKRLENGQKPVSKMIDELGLKGYKIGDAEISTIHAGFIVNKDKATCKDVKSLIQYIRSRIKSSYGESLELEIKLVGDTDDT